MHFIKLLILTLVLVPMIGYTQSNNLCELKSVTDLSMVKINLTEFTHIDTTIGDHHYNVVFICSNGTIILGNKNEKEIKNGRWSFKRFHSTGYEGYISGNFLNDKMDGYWSHGPYSSLFVKGKFVKTYKIPF